MKSVLLQLGKWALGLLVAEVSERLARHERPKEPRGRPLSHKDVAHQQAQIASSVAASRTTATKLRVVK